MPLKTLFLNPPSFENYDGGASSRWPATREIESYWYPVWLAYPAGMLEGSRLLDASPHQGECRADHRDRQGVRVPGAVHQHARIPGGHQAGGGDEGRQSQAEDRFRRPARHHPARARRSRKARPWISSSAANSTTPPWNIANGKPLSEILGVSYRGKDGRDRAQRRPAGGRRSGRAAGCGGRLQARYRSAPL